MGTGRPRGGRLPSEAFVGSRSDPPQHRFWQELTQHTQQVEEGLVWVAQPKNPQKKKGRNGSGSPLLACSPVTCAWPRLLGSCSTFQGPDVQQGSIAPWLRGWDLFPRAASRFQQEVLLGSISPCTRAPGAPEQAQVADVTLQSYRPSALFLDSRPFAPSGSDCLTREVESAVPGPPFLKVIQEKMSSCPVLPQRHSMGNVWLGAFSSLQDPVPQHYLCTTKPLGRKYSMLLPQSQCPCSSPHCLMVYNKEQNVG